MADARSMLRASREARKIKHPHASYASDGKLLCNLCETTIKAESAWQAHLHSTQHTLRLNRAQDAAAARSSANVASKKRKASISNLDSPASAERKKPKPTNFAPGVEDEDDAVATEAKDSTKPQPPVQSNAPVSRTDGVADPAELEAFERELQEMEASMKREVGAHAEVTISAPAMTAEQIAAQARTEQSAQRGKRDAELEEEREDAAKLLEDEFEEMEGLEARAKRLREKREALRRRPSSAAAGDGTDAAPHSNDMATSHGNKYASQGGDGGSEDKDDEEGDEDDDDDDELDEWRFGVS